MSPLFFAATYIKSGDKKGILSMTPISSGKE